MDRLLVLVPRLRRFNALASARPVARARRCNVRPVLGRAIVNQPDDWQTSCRLFTFSFISQVRRGVLRPRSEDTADRYAECQVHGSDFGPSREVAKSEHHPGAAPISATAPAGRRVQRVRPRPHPVAVPCVGGGSGALHGAPREPLRPARLQPVLRCVRGVPVDPVDLADCVRLGGLRRGVGVRCPGERRDGGLRGDHDRQASSRLVALVGWVRVT